jgi:hypothetical protein
VVTRYITAIGHLVRGRTAPDAYEALKGPGYLSGSALDDPAGVISLIAQVQTAFPDPPPPGRELWRDIDAALERAGYLGPKGLTEGRRAVTRDGEEL